MTLLYLANSHHSIQAKVHNQHSNNDALKVGVTEAG